MDEFPDEATLADLARQATGWRRHLHAMPELGFETTGTAAFVGGLLRGWGCNMVQEMVGGSAVVARIDGAAPGRAIALRADMDALPIAETSGKPWSSQVPGKMHACGHDGHTASLLAAALDLASRRDFPGSVLLVFQPAEETGGGARAMLEDGLLDVCDFVEIYGAHNHPGLGIGAFGCRSGVFAASADVFDVALTGKGCHAAQPWDGIDPLAAAARLLPRLAVMPGRLTDAMHPALLSVTALGQDTDAHNVLPGRATMKGTVRTLDESVRRQIADAFERVVRAEAEGAGLGAEIDYRFDYPVLVNAPEQTAHAADVAAVIGPVDRAVPAVLGAEDFAFFLQRRPGAYILYGNGDTEACHHPAYDFSDAALPHVISWYAGLARIRLRALARAERG